MDNHVAVDRPKRKHKGHQAQVTRPYKGKQERSEVRHNETLEGLLRLYVRHSVAATLGRISGDKPSLMAMSTYKKLSDKGRTLIDKHLGGKDESNPKVVSGAILLAIKDREV